MSGLALLPIATTITIVPDAELPQHPLRREPQNPVKAHLLPNSLSLGTGQSSLVQLKN